MVVICHSLLENESQRAFNMMRAEEFARMGNLDFEGILHVNTQQPNIFANSTGHFTTDDSY